MIGMAPQIPVALCGITLHIVAPIATLPVAFTSGIGTFVYPGFCDPAWLGVELATQLFSIDPTGPCATIPLVASDLHVHRYGD